MARAREVVVGSVCFLVASVVCHAGELSKVSLQSEPGDPKALVASGKAWVAKKAYDKAISSYSEALRLDARNFDALSGRAEARYFKKDFDGAIKDYDELVRLYPNTPVLHGLRGYAWLAKGNTNQAIKDFDEAVRLDRKDAGSFIGRALAWRNQKEYGKAIDDYAEGIRLNPKDTESCNQVAWLLATCPNAGARDGKRAVHFAAKACELNGWKSGGYIDTLAAAHAEAGQFEEAVRYQKQALQIPLYKGPAGNAMRQRLQLYEQRKAYHQAP